MDLEADDGLVAREHLGHAVAGLAVLAASLVLLWLTLDLKDSPMVPVGPGFYPRIVLVITATLAVTLATAAKVLWLARSANE